VSGGLSALRVAAILTIGSVAAPVIYVVLGYAYPQGFHDMRSATFQTVAMTLGAAWLVSWVLTLALGGLVWKMLHAKSLDGFGSYAAIAVLGALAIYFVADSGRGSAIAGVFVAALATANAALVRTAELLLSRTRII